MQLQHACRRPGRTAQPLHISSRRKTPRLQRRCSCRAEPTVEPVRRREALLGLAGGAAALAWGAQSAQPASADVGDVTTLYGMATPPTSYGGYGGNAKEAAKYIFDYPKGWKKDTVNKTEKGMQGIDARVINPKIGKKQGAFVVTFGRAGEDKKFSKLGDVEQTLQGFAGADYDLQDALVSATGPGAKKSRRREVQISEGTPPDIFYDYEVQGENLHYLASITLQSGKVFALFVKSPSKVFEQDRDKLQNILDTFKEHRSVKAMTLQHCKRTFDMFAGNWGERPQVDEPSHRAKLVCKVGDEYSVGSTAAAAAAAAVQAGGPQAAAPGPAGRAVPSLGGATAAAAAPAAPSGGRSVTERMLDNLQPKQAAAGSSKQLALVAATNRATARREQALVPTATGGHKPYTPSAEVARRMPSKWPRPRWHAPWKCYRVLAGHLGWVRSLAVDPTNEWFVTGSADRTIKFWDLASGQLKLTLTGHIEQVTGLAISDRMPYMFSCGLDKLVKCWDLESNKVIRHYHGHLSGVYSLALHPTIDVLFTGGRDSVVRVWDVRTKVGVHVLQGHGETVASLITGPTDPQVISGSHDKTIRLWDLRAKRTLATLTHHKKSVRAMASHPREHCFASASADNTKKFRLPRGEFLFNMLQQQKCIVNSMAISEDDVMVTAGDTGSLWFWDWRSGNCFQQEVTKPQPGSLESETGIFASSFDMSGSRLITAEADKSIKMWKEDEHASEATHPINFRPPRDIRRF